MKFEFVVFLCQRTQITALIPWGATFAAQGYGEPRNEASVSDRNEKHLCTYNTESC